MDELKLTAKKREVLGKKSRFLRRQGITPTHLFGHSLDSQALQCDTAELLKVLAHAGTTRLVTLKVEGDKETKPVFFREIQRDGLSRTPLHVDFYQVRKDEKLQMEVPIVLVGEAPAMRGKGRLLSRGIQNLRIECLPSKVPPQIEVDVSGLIELEQSIYVKDIVLDKDILVHADPGQLVAKVTEIIIKVEEEKVVVAAEAVAAEGEAAAGEAGAKPVAEGGAAPAAAAGGAEKAQKAEKPQKAEKK